MSGAKAARFSALGKPLGDAEQAESDAYLSCLGFDSPIHRVFSWDEALEVCIHPAEAWWNAEEANATLIRAAAGAAAYAAYQERLARAAGATCGYPFLHEYALYCGGRWPLGVYEGRFAIF